MGLSSRLLLIPAGGALRPLAERDFGRLCEDGCGWRIPALSGQRFRWASVVVELFNRQPVRVVHRTFALSLFDDAGRLDVARMNRDQVARMDVALSPPSIGEPVIEASSRHAGASDRGQRLDDGCVGPRTSPFRNRFAGTGHEGE